MSTESLLWFNNTNKHTALMFVLLPFIGVWSVNMNSVQYQWPITVNSGSNYCWEPPQSFQKLAHDLIDKCGIDIIHGHSSHHIQVSNMACYMQSYNNLLQGIEIYDNKPIIYGCGDFIE